MLQYINKKNIIIFITISIIVIALYFYSKKDKIDCKLSDWIWDNQCNCEQPINGQGKKFAYRNSIQKAQNGGKECSNNQDDFYTNELCQCSASPTPKPTMIYYQLEYGYYVDVNNNYINIMSGGESIDSKLGLGLWNRDLFSYTIFINYYGNIKKYYYDDKNKTLQDVNTNVLFKYGPAPKKNIPTTTPPPKQTPGSQSPDRNGSNIPSVSGKSFERAVYYGFSKINFIDNTNVLFESNKGTYTFNNTTNKGSMTIYQLYQAPSLYNFSYDSLSKKISIDNLGIYVIVD